MRPRAFRPRSLRAILAIFVALFLIALIAVRAANYTIAHNALEHEVDRRLAGEAATIAGLDGDLTAMVARIDAAQGNHDTADLYYLLTDNSGRRLAGTLRPHRPLPTGYSNFGEEAQVDGVAHGRALVRSVAGAGTLVVVSDNDEVVAFDRLLANTQLIGLGVTALIVIGGAMGIALAIGGRMRAMQRTVDAVIAGDLHSRVPLDGTRSEFDRQAAAFNRMLDRIDELMVNVKHAARDVTHELKSPLARLRGQIAAMARHAEGNPLQGEIDDALVQTDQLLDLFSSLLRLWEIEGGHRRERFAPVDLAALAEEVAQSLQVVAEDAGRSLIIGAIPATTIRGDINLLRQLLVNLVENAIRHTPPGSRIDLALERTAHVVRVIVADDGPGIPTDRHEAVIRRFGRLEAPDKPDGQGLGLTLVDAIARLHHGTLKLGDSGPGLRAVVELPLEHRAAS
ncbi:MAG: ATP-binding protein [Pseudomonadota bacterium]